MRRRTGVVATAAVVCAVLLASCSSAADVANSPPGPAATPSLPSSSAPPGPRPPATGSTSSSGSLPDAFGPGPTGHGLSRFYDQKVTWTSCGSGFTCGSFWVPLDYDKPNGPAITIKAKMNPADDQSTKLGSLFIDPGGPGVSGVDYVGQAHYDQPLTNAYDIIGFDPRGVGSSTAVNCVSDSQLDAYVASDPEPQTPAEVTQLQKIWSAFTAGCVANSGPLLQHVSTVEVARDLDVMRAVVGDKKLNYFGASYGTYIGANYAALFPEHVGRMVLDGAVDPLAKPHQTDLNVAAGFETALTAYLGYCVDQGDCPLGDSVSAARQSVIDLLNKVGSAPMQTSTPGRDLTQGLAFYGIVLPLYSRSFWPYLTQAFQQTDNNDGSLMLALADSYTGRQPDGSYSSNELEAQVAVNCLDNPEHESVAQIEADGAQFDKVSPVFGPVAAWFPYSCSNWPVKRIQPQPDYAAKGAPPIVVVGTTRDPATPYEQAVNLAKELDSGVLLSRNGDGHTAYDSGNSCIDDAIDSFLADGTVPANHTMC